MRSLFLLFLFSITITPAMAISGVGGAVFETPYCAGVCGSDPSPFSNALIYSGNYTTYADATGSYFLELAPGLYNIVYSKDPTHTAHTALNITVVANTTTEQYTTLMLKQTGNITGRVCSEGGCPQPYTHFNHTEYAINGTYTLIVDFNSVVNSSEYHNHTAMNETFLNADIFGTVDYTLYTNGTNGTNGTIYYASFPHFNISLTNLTIGENYSVILTQDYNYNLSMSVLDQVVPLRSNVTVKFHTSDADNNALNISGTLVNVSTIYGVSPHDFQNLSPGTYAYNLGVIEYATTGLNVYNIDGVKIVKSSFDGSQITFRDTGLNIYNIGGARISSIDSAQSGTLFSIFSASGNLESMLLSNGSTYTITPGSHVVQVVPSDAGYRDSPIQLFDLFIVAAGVVFGFILLAVLAVGLGDVVRKITEVWA